MSAHDCKSDGMCKSAAICFLDGCQAEKAAPAQGELSDAQIDSMWRHSCDVGGMTTQEFTRHFARALESRIRGQGVSDAADGALLDAMLDDAKRNEQDAARYRFLEYQCRTGTYRGIISRAAIDAAILAQANGGMS